MEPALKPFTRQAGSAFDGCVLQAQNVRCSNPTNQSMVYRAIYRVSTKFQIHCGLH